MNDMHVVLFFGEMGAGKTYHAQRYQSEATQLWFVEGDNYVPSDMQERVKSFRLPTEDMVERLVLRLANVPALTPIDSQCKGFIICQALYRDAHRDYLIRHWTRLGYKVTAVWVKASFWQNLRQLLKRPKGWRWVAYWLLNKTFFQKPTHAWVGLDEFPPF